MAKIDSTIILKLENFPKPIFTIEMPFITPSDEIIECERIMANKLTDYHVIVYRGKNDYFQFNCFSIDIHDNTSWDEIKKYLNNE